MYLFIFAATGQYMTATDQEVQRYYRSLVQKSSSSPVLRSGALLSVEDVLAGSALHRFREHMKVRHQCGDVTMRVPT